VERTKIIVSLPMILQSFSFILLKKGILEKYFLQNPKRQRMEERWNKKEREREREKIK
jgi:hypothetical protein